MYHRPWWQMPRVPRVPWTEFQNLERAFLRRLAEMGHEGGSRYLGLKLTEDVGTCFHDFCRFDDFLYVRQDSKTTSREHAKTDQDFPGESFRRTLVWNEPNDEAIQTHTFHTTDLNEQDRVMVA